MKLTRRSRMYGGMSSGQETHPDECFHDLEKARREVTFLELELLVKEGFISELKGRLFELESQLRKTGAELNAKNSELAKVWTQKNREIDYLKNLLGTEQGCA